MDTNVYEEIKNAMEITAKLESLRRYVNDEADGLLANLVCNEGTYPGKVKTASELIAVNKVKEVITAIRSDCFRKESDQANMEWIIRIIRQN